MRLKLYYPVKPYHLNQPWGANEACVKDFGLPTQRVVGKTNGTCPIGYDELYPHFGMRGHNGLDLQAGEQYVYASHDGVVVEAQKVPARGLGIGLLTNEPVELDAYGTHYVKSRYWHLKQLFVDVGDAVKTGQPLGITDTTGYSAGNHLHYEIQPMDKDAGGHPFLTFNGDNPNYPKPLPIAAAIDPQPFFCGEYALDQMLIPLQLQVVILLKKLLEALKKK